MAQIQFYANVKGNLSGSDGVLIDHASGSGLGFYGTGWGVSVPIGTKQRTTFVTDANGLTQGVQLNNTETIDLGSISTAGTVSVNSSDAINTNNLPNYLCPLNIRFTNSSPVRVQNCKLRIFDRNNINNHASGVTTYVYEARHPSELQEKTNLSHRGRASNDWFEFDPATNLQDMIFTSSPGASGLNTNSSDIDTSLGYTTQSGVLHSDTRHDWYVAISSEPDSIGSKTQYGLYFSVEYL